VRCGLRELARALHSSHDADQEPLAQGRDPEPFRARFWPHATPELTFETAEVALGRVRLGRARVPLERVAQFQDPDPPATDTRRPASPPERKRLGAFLSRLTVAMRAKRSGLVGHTHASPVRTRPLGATASFRSLLMSQRVPIGCPNPRELALKAGNRTRTCTHENPCLCSGYPRLSGTRRSACHAEGSRVRILQPLFACKSGTFRPGVTSPAA
jgi:hypothetical protein